ncbi:MAG TPA: hypothetical protein PLJ84_12525 [Bacteroidales bacterium]|nr:hypothetical protein [Bacteroidales bacterium]HPT03416.1 hypothetical protein [Bacteroidales bacterium]
MKKISLIAVLFLVMAGVSFFSACTPDEKEDLSPTLSFVTGSGLISGDATLKAGEGFTVNISAAANSSSGAKLTNLKVVRTLGGNEVVVTDETIDQSSFTGEITANAAFIAGSETWSFKVTDANGEYAEISFIITTTAGGEINTFDQKILGSYYNNTYGSFFGSADGTVYKLVDAYNNQAKIDWCYYYGSEIISDHGATLAAPNDPTAMNNVYTNPTYGLSQWSVRNATTFFIVPDQILWDNITDDAMIIAYASATNDTYARELAVGKIVAFKTASGKLGLIRVTDIQTGSQGSITYNVKVQK